MTHFDVADRPLASSDAFDPVPLVVVRKVNPLIGITEGCFKDGAGIAFDLTPIDIKGPLSAFERAAAWAPMKHLNSVRISELQARGGSTGRRRDFYRAAFIHA